MDARQALDDYIFIRDSLNPFHGLRYDIDTGKPRTTQLALAELSDLSEQMIYRHERGLMNTPSPKVMNALIELHGTSGIATYAYIYESLIEERLQGSPVENKRKEITAAFYQDAKNGRDISELAAQRLIISWYEYWVAAVRSKLRDYCELIGLRKAMSEWVIKEDFTRYKHAPLVMTYITWHEQFKQRTKDRSRDSSSGTPMVRAINTPRSGGRFNASGFCKLVALHPYTLQQARERPNPFSGSTIVTAAMDPVLSYEARRVLDEKSIEWWGSR